METLIYSLKITFLFIILPAACILLIRFLSNLANQKLVNIFGFNSQIYVGGLGVIIHELSHLVLAIIFLHHIDAVCLLRIPNNSDPNDTSLGYVRHSWSTNSVYQTIGNVFIGVAPVLCCTFIIFLILSSLNAPIQSVHDRIYFQLRSNNLNFETIFNAVGNYFTGIFKAQISSLPRTILDLVLITSICFGGFDLSSADLKASKFAFFVLLTSTFILSFLIAALHAQAIFSSLLINAAVWIYLLFFISIFTLIFINLLMFILYLVF